MPQVSYLPSKDIVGKGTYQNTLARWLNRQRMAQSQFASAEQPLQQNVQMFQPGGGYGAGQKGLLETQSRQAQAEALSRQVSTGMSSGSLAIGTGLRVKRDLTQSLLGIEDTRTQFLAKALQGLSGLRGQRAQTTAAAVDPTFAPYMGYIGQRHGQAAGQSIAAGQRQTQLQTLGMQIQAQRAAAAASEARARSGGAYSTMRF